ncbi:hypothetical protein CRE_30557 [Caenorhabditis remanei]|uniref:F-box domain-containing protein n=1 Tax=Caenorhabditis remanei TaxID=31234 RepID=E3NMQ8_CAERE|nr:hypothetical protein CRE_30557 [Caenorhabditis remanei]
MSSPFPLLRLPRLVMFEVFKSLSIGEKIQLSLCSKKTLAQFNNARLYSQKVHVHLDMTIERIQVYPEDFKDWFQIGIHIDRKIDNPTIQLFGRRIVPMYKTIKTYWKNLGEGFLCVTRHLLKMFHCEISTGKECWRNDFFQPVISELFEQQVKFKTLTIRLYGSTDENLFWNQISNKFGLVKDLSISSVANLGFSPVFISWPQAITIMNSDWFTLETLWTCPCSFINLENSTLKHMDLNEILRKWMSGGFPNLDLLKIHTLRFRDYREDILGMDWMELSVMVIQTDDGLKKATFKTDHQSIEMSVSPFE